MQTIGIVLKVNNENSCEVSVARVSMCGENCGACKGGCKPSDKVVCADCSNFDLKAGDRVVLSTNSNYVLLSAFCVYVLPLFALVAGWFVGSAIFDKEIFIIFSAICFLIFFFLIVNFADKKIKKRKKCAISVSKVLHK